jgi:hypothetical protein
MRSLIERARALLVTKTPADQLDEVRQKIAEADNELDRLNVEFKRRALPILQGDTEAAREAADLEREKQALAGELATLRTAEGQFSAAVAAEQRAEAQAAASALPRRVAEAAAALLDVDDEIHRVAAGLAEAIRARKAAGLALADLAGSQQLRQVNGGTAGRIRDSIARYFQDPGDARVDGNDLRLASSLRGSAAHMTLRQRDRELLDDVAPWFLTQAAAAEASARLAARTRRPLFIRCRMVASP